MLSLAVCFTIKNDELIVILNPKDLVGIFRIISVNAKWNMIGGFMFTVTFGFIVLLILMPNDINYAVLQD